MQRPSIPCDIENEEPAQFQLHNDSSDDEASGSAQRPEDLRKELTCFVIPCSLETFKCNTSSVTKALFVNHVLPNDSVC